MPLAAPLILPFAELAGITIAGLGMAAASKKVSDFISDNPEISTQILTTLVPGGVGLNALFKDKDAPSTKDIVLGELGKEKGNYSSPDAEGAYSSKRGRIIKALEEAGKIKKGPNKDYDSSKKYKDYKKFYEKADGGRIGYVGGGLATTQDFANALKSVSAGTTYQQQTQAKEYARNEASNLLSQAMRSADPNKGPGLQGIYDTFFKNQNVTGIRPKTFTPDSSGRMIMYSARDRDAILDSMANQMLNTTPYAAPKPRPKTYRTVSPEAQALNMSQSTYEDIIRSGADPKQYYIDYQNRMMTEGGNYGTPGTSSYTGPQLLKYGQVIGGPGMVIAGPGTAPGATPPTQAQMNQMMQNNPAGYMDFADLVKTYSADPYKGLQEEIKDMVDGRDTGYMGGQDYYDTNVLGLDGRGIAEKYGLQYADGGRIGFANGGDSIINKDLISLFRGQPLFGQTTNQALSSYPNDKMLSGRFFTTEPDIAKSYAKNSSFPSVVKEMKVPSNVLDKAYNFKSRLQTLPSKTFEMINMNPRVVIANKNMLRNYKPSINIPATLSSNFSQGLGFLKQNALRTLAILGSLPFQAGIMTLSPTKMGNAELPQMPQGSPSIINQGGGGSFDTSRGDRAGTSLGSGQFSPKTSRGRSGYGIGGLV